ncbi:MAG: methylmalonyl-CoA carboxyltransferase [Firmicutes bacterium]|nr:methylmalonyl-CoA carboxyltransferase [Bacillota bacterium]
MGTLDKVNEHIARMNSESSIAQKRLEELFDENGFIEIGGHNTEAGVVTGFGYINGRLVYAYSQDGPVSVAHANKIAKLYENALKMGAPIVGILDSEGLLIEDGVDIFEAYGIMFSKQCCSSGVIPQISIIVGDCLGTAAFSPLLSDFIVMTESNAKFFMTSPSTFDGLEGKATSYDELGGAKGQAGMIHLSYKDEKGCFDGVRELLDMLPSNNIEEPYIEECTDDINREDEALNSIISDDEKADVRAIITSIADNNHFMEFQKNYTTEAIVGFIKLNGTTIGVIANNGLLDVDAMKKMGGFASFCDAFNIPILTITDIEGYVSSVEEERRGLLRYGAKLMFTLKNSTVPRVNLLIRHAVGNAYVVMNSKHIGADIVLAWPTASIAIMDKASYTNIMELSADEYDKVTSPEYVASKGYIDDVIIPSATRKRLIAVFDMLASKRVLKHARKHSSVEF